MHVTILMSCLKNVCTKKYVYTKTVIKHKNILVSNKKKKKICYTKTLIHCIATFITKEKTNSVYGSLKIGYVSTVYMRVCFT